MGVLYLVATPLGNLEDITLRALRILREVDLIAAEDTRRTRILLSHYQIRTPMTSYYEGNQIIKLDYILEAMQHGDVALVSEAGMPGISDPGYELVRATIERGHPVVPIPGPSAVVAALAASGLPTDSFLYLGFLPRKRTERLRLLESVRDERKTLVAFEAPHRVLESLKDIQDILGDREIAVARELTKIHEEIVRGRLSQVRATLEKKAPKGEFTLVMAGAEEERWDEARIKEGLRALETLKRNDPQEMGRRIAELPQQCRVAWDIMKGYKLPGEYGEVDEVVVLGMGGSAIGGDLLRILVEKRAPAPVLVVRDYTLPHFVGNRTLVIASSYSGNTEETLTALEEAVQRGARIVAITTDGQLAKKVEKPRLIVFDYKSQPRAAIGFSLVLLLGILSGFGFIPDPWPDLEEAIGIMERLTQEIDVGVPTAKNPAKQLATRLLGKVPVVYGAEHLAEVARRWKTQFNENSKTTAFWDIIPELNHNTINGYDFPVKSKDSHVFLLLSSSLYHPQNSLRFNITEEVLTMKGLLYQAIEAQGKSIIAQALYMVHFNDYLSLYLATLNGVDPSPVETISYLKRRLAQAKP